MIPPTRITAQIRPIAFIPSDSGRGSRCLQAKRRPGPVRSSRPRARPCSDGGRAGSYGQRPSVADRSGHPPGPVARPSGPPVASLPPRRRTSSQGVSPMIMRTRPPKGGDAAALRPRSRRRLRRPGAARRQVRRDVDLHELHVPVVQLPQPAGRAAVLRPGRLDRRRGVRPHRAGLDRDQHDADRRGESESGQRGRAERRQGHPQHAAVPRRRRRGDWSRTRWASPGAATTSTPAAT